MKKLYELIKKLDYMVKQYEFFHVPTGCKSLVLSDSDKKLLQTIRRERNEQG